MSEAALAAGVGRGNPPAAYRFKPGQSGNPSGRPRKLAELAALSQSCYPEALRRLVELINSRNEDTAKWAITVVLGYVLGKPADSIVMLEGLKARLGENLMTPLQAIAQHSEDVPAPPLTAPEPQVCPTTPLADRPPEAPAVTPVGGESLGFEMTPERAEFLREINPEKPAVSLAGADSLPPGPEPAVTGPHCLYRTKSGPCGAPTEGQWCEVHRKLLFASLGDK